MNSNNGRRRRPIGVDLFAGAGGMSLGFEQAGFDIAAAVEVDPIHAATHHFNFPETAIIPSPIERVSGGELLAQAGVQQGSVDVVFGGAPCQGFSLIGQRALEDPRNRLVKEFVRVVSEIQPKYFVFENVKGLTVGRHRKFLLELIEEFTAVGYEVVMPWRVLNAANYGVPQSRERLILLGARRDLPLPDYPVATTAYPLDSDMTKPSPPNCRDAIGDLPDVDDIEELLATDSIRIELPRPLSVYAARLRCLHEDSWGNSWPRSWDASLLTSSSRTKHTAISRRRFASTQPGTVEPISRFFRLPENGVSNTLRAGTDSARGAFTSPRPIHYRDPRCITVREMARLHGFPDWFRFHATKWHGARQIGNAVPPPLAMAIGTAVMTALGTVATRPEGRLELGDPQLLYMDMTRAAAHFDVPVPIGRRDRKSGNRKRKQEDIELKLTRRQEPE